MTELLGKGPAAFDLVAVLGQEGDPTDDLTFIWDEATHATAPLGTIEIDTIAPNEKCDAISFLPTNLPDGIASPANDPIFAARSSAYIVSLGRRNAP